MFTNNNKNNNKQILTIYDKNNYKINYNNHNYNL